MFKLRGWVRLVVLAISLGVACPPQAHATNEAKIFLTTTTYGLMAGSLTGLASLAFVGSPGDHLRNVAVGASLGLYAGLLLGAYLVYGIPDGTGNGGGGGKPKLEPSSIQLNNSKPIPFVTADASGMQGGFAIQF